MPFNFKPNADENEKFKISTMFLDKAVVYGTPVLSTALRLDHSNPVLSDINENGRMKLHQVTSSAGRAVLSIKSLFGNVHVT